MTPQQILVKSLDYRRIIEKAGAVLPENTIRYANGLVEYLCACAECKDECNSPECLAGAPYSVDLEDAKVTE